MDTTKATFWLSFFRFFLLCYQFIPVSLYVTLSLVYSIQSRIMQSDLKLYDYNNNNDDGNDDDDDDNDGNNDVHYY